MLHLTPAQLLRTSLLAGVVAGLALGLFHLVVSEPIIDRAIELEEEHRAEAAPEAGHEAVFSRRVQKGGLVAGAVLYGLAVGLIFGGVWAVARPGTPRGEAWVPVALLALVAAWVTGIAPFLKYPANPPGIGDPETVYVRQLHYLLFIGGNVAGVAVAERLRRALRRGPLGPQAALAAAAAAYALFLAALAVVLPGSTDASAVPASLLWQFRAASLAGHALFWCLLGGLFAYFVQRGSRGTEVGAAPPPAGVGS